MSELKPRRRRRHLVAAVAAAFLLLAGVGLGAAGGVQAAEGGYFSTSYHRFSTTTAALKSDEIEVGPDRAHAADPNPDLGEVARVRIVVRPADPSVPMFVGIGPKAQVESYLRGTAYDDFRSAELRPFRPRFERNHGAAQAPSPNGRPFWVATSQGTGTRTLTWDKTHGAWSVVVMRLDGRPGVDVTASIALRFGFLLPGAASALLAATVLLAYALTARRRPEAEQALPDEGWEDAVTDVTVADDPPPGQGQEPATGITAAARMTHLPTAGQ